MKIKPELQKEYEDYVKVNSNDFYSKGVVDYAQRWADAMEAALAKGETIPACAKGLSHECDAEGITGFMYGCAVQALARFWVHGEELRTWHNLDTQIGTEGGEYPLMTHFVRCWK